MVTHIHIQTDRKHTHTETHAKLNQDLKDTTWISCIDCTFVLYLRKLFFML